MGVPGERQDDSGEACQKEQINIALWLQQQLAAGLEWCLIVEVHTTQCPLRSMIARVPVAIIHEKRRRSSDGTHLE